MEPSTLTLAAAATAAVAGPVSGRYAFRRLAHRRRREATVATPRPLQEAFYLAVKRGIDIVGAMIGLVLLAPMFLLVALLVRLDSPGPAFHRRRVLRQQHFDAFTEDRELQTFAAYKFRTMVVDADELLRRDPELRARYEREYKLNPDPRVTRIGRLLRKTSLDELPQLVNILRGQMSLVGPRFITTPELRLYGEHAARYLSVRPGLTGWWQVSGRSEVVYAERVKLDMWYIAHRSLLLDLWILVRTVGCVLRRRGAC